MNILLQCGDHFENQQRVLLLAKELKNMGHNIKVILYSEPLGNLFKVEGVDVVYYYSYRNENKQKFKGKLDELNFSSIVGFSSVSKIIEVEKQRRPEISWPSKVERTSKDAAMHYYTTLDIILDTEPDIIGVWNGYTGLVANTLRILSEDLKIPSFFMERGIFKNSIFIDKLGCNGAASIANVDYEKETETLSDVDKNYIYDMFREKRQYNNKSLLDSDYSYLEGKKIIFFPLQVTRDTNIILYSKVESMRHAFYEIYERMNGDNVFFVIRPHPEESNDQYINLPILDNVLVCSKESLEFWIENSDMVVTINSTVGLEAIIKRKNITTLGKGIYSSFKYKNNLYDQFDKTKLDNIGNNEYIDELKSYLSYLLCFNTIVDSSKYNRNVIKKQIPWLDRTEYVNSSDKIKKYKEKAVSYLAKIEKPILNINIDPTSKVNLTYRTSKTPISKEWISTIACDFGVHSPEVCIKSTKSSHLMICDEGYAFDSKQADVIVDIYGNTLSIFGVKLL